GALLLDRILCRHHQERLVERITLVTERDLLLLHRLEQRRLHLRGRPVHLVRQHQVGEQGPTLRGERAVARTVDQRAREIRGQQVGGELNAVERERERIRQ